MLSIPYFTCGYASAYPVAPPMVMLSYSKCDTVLTSCNKMTSAIVELLAKYLANN